nr:hypothetical protein [Paraburkholderia sp. BL8N3]
MNGNLSLVTHLAAAGLPIDHANSVGATCLMYAASAGKADLVLQP